MKGLTTACLEVEEAFPRTINARKTHQQPQVEPTTRRLVASARKAFDIEKGELSPPLFA
jgi:hypothetical protein